MIDTPALAYPATVFTRVTPAAVIKNTIKTRVCAVRGILKPESIPLLMVPIDTIPVRAGAKVTNVPGTAVKILSGVDDVYNCACTVTVLPTRLNAAVVLK